MTQPEDSDVDASVAEREDLVEHIGRGDGVRWPSCWSTPPERRRGQSR